MRSIAWAARRTFRCQSVCETQGAFDSPWKFHLFETLQKATICLCQNKLQTDTTCLQCLVKLTPKLNRTPEQYKPFFVSTARRQRSQVALQQCTNQEQKLHRRKPTMHMIDNQAWVQGLLCSSQLSNIFFLKRRMSRF